MADIDSQVDLDQVQTQQHDTRSKTVKHKDWLQEHDIRLEALESFDLEERLKERLSVELAGLGERINSLKEDVCFLKESQ